MRRATLMWLGAMLMAGLTICATGWDRIGFMGFARAGSASLPQGLVLPELNAELGKSLFASKGCVVCHSINGVGGSDAAPLDAESMDPAGNPFEFFARMLTGMAPMLAMQENRLGHQVELDAEELGNIVAFIHDESMQKGFSTNDVPENMQHLIDEN